LIPVRRLTDDNSKISYIEQSSELYTPTGRPVPKYK